MTTTGITLSIQSLADDEPARVTIKLNIVRMRLFTFSTLLEGGS